MRYLLLIYTAEPTGHVQPTRCRPSRPNTARSPGGPARTGCSRPARRSIRRPRATTVQVRDGRTITTDGPFAETKEALGGFYLIEAHDLDEAIDAAARIPGARHGSIEIRPIFELAASDGAGDAAGDAVDEAVAPAG